MNSTIRSSLNQSKNANNATLRLSNLSNSFKSISTSKDFENLSELEKQRAKVTLLKHKFNDLNVPIITLVNACELRDPFHDGFISLDCFEEAIDSVVGYDKFTRREKIFLIESCDYTKASNKVYYIKLLALFGLQNIDENRSSITSTNVQCSSEDLFPKPDYTLSRSSEFFNFNSKRNFMNTTNSSTRNESKENQEQNQTSIGNWLSNNSCPSEINNFQLFIKCLENFEKQSGLRIKANDDGFLIPLGPDLRATVNFKIAKP